MGMKYIRTEENAGKRFASGAIDYIIVFGFTYAYIMIFGEPNMEGGKTVTGLPALVPMVFWFCWLVLSELLFKTTLGHKINSLKVVSMNGGQVTVLQILKRRICDIVEIVWCFGLIAFILIKNTQYHQRLGDIWAKTLVVNEDYSFDDNDFEFEKIENS